MKKKLFAVVFCFSFCGMAWAASNEAQSLSVPCAGCHGSEGASKGEIPVIGGLSKVYLEATMKNYKNEVRYSTVMTRIAQGYSDQQIAAIGEYFSNQPWIPGSQEINASMAKRGEKLHMEKGCAGCHGAVGISSIATVPRLAGQYARYLFYQMADYQDPDKPISAAARPMRGMLAGLSDDDLEALAHFYASQK